MQKNGRKCKKRAKVHFQFQNSYKKGKRKKTCFAFISPVPFLPFKPQNSCKKRKITQKKRKKKRKKTFSNLKKMQKKYAKKGQK